MEYREGYKEREVCAKQLYVALWKIQHLTSMTDKCAPPSNQNVLNLQSFKYSFDMNFKRTVYVSVLIFKILKSFLKIIWIITDFNIMIIAWINNADGNSYVIEEI